ncbi:MAG TPA: glycosyltransferase family 87 protein, partial [Anaerolineales bacterium]|nr:glycosyltransferase family 87 protein [Anaerolineales bacterium]
MASIPFGPSQARPVASGRWLNLLAAAAGAALAIYAVVSITSRGLFEYWGADFAAFRAAAEVARDDGYANVYDLEKLGPPERRLVQSYAAEGVQAGFEVIPVPYLPVFILPFGILLLPGPTIGWVLWTALNAAILLLYSRRLAQAFGAERRISALVLLVALPTFLTLAFGQVNVWLAIGFGEFLIALQRRKELAAGAWLGLLLLKPQILVWLALGLAFGRRWRVLAGLAMAAAVVLGASLLLAGVGGLAALVSLWLGYAGNLPTTFPESMMNWRGLAANLEPLLAHTLTVTLLIVGTTITAAAGVWLWIRARPGRDPQPAAAGSYAASSTVAWHSHVHMALPLVTLVGN